MADQLLVTIAGEILKKLLSTAFDEISGVLGVEKDLKLLQFNLTKIQAILHDADKKQVEDETVKLWLKILKDLAYDAEDMLDEAASDALRHKIKKVHNSSSPSIPLAFRLKMARKIICINQNMLKEIEKEKDMFQHIHTQTRENRETHSVLDDSKVVGRENDKSTVVNFLMSSTHEDIVSVVSIVGMGGLGKTTLAQLAYNDEDVKTHFCLRMWICVSYDCDFKTLLRKILESIPENKCGVSSTANMMACDLLEKLRGKKFLLVLDDVWNVDEETWGKLESLLKGGARGSKIIVTTRSNEITSIMGACLTLHLQKLSEAECWDLFKVQAFNTRGPEETSNLVVIGKEIVKKSGGVPLAVKTLGVLMHSKTEEHEWLSVKNCEIRDLTRYETGILPTLKLSYDPLPPFLKQCFSYCSMFPKNYNINKKMLIQLWMAEGFLQPSEGSRPMEDIGDEYIKILSRSSLFEDVQKNEYEVIHAYKMHDLVHDLARSVVGFECSIVEARRLEEDISAIRRLSLVYNEEISSIPRPSHRQPNKLRTFISPSLKSRYSIKGFEVVFLNFKCLRVLDLHGTGIKKLPSSIGKLKLLRYLDLSLTYLEALPESITRLCNLQTLNLKHCRNLKEFPRNMKKLINLRHLEIDNLGRWTQMPTEIGKLSSLQTLPVFKVGKDKGHDIIELQCLNLLAGELRIENLQNVRDGICSMGANLKGKQNIHTLQLHWEGCTSDDNLRSNIDHVLEGLRPHKNLKRLEISYFMGMKLASWMSSSSLPNLVEITLKDCNRCADLPALGQLSSLKVLKIAGMNVVKCLGKDFYGNGARAFSSLKTLELSWMLCLKEWLEFPSSFPCLEVLSIYKCPMLTITPSTFPSLKELRIEMSNSKVVSLLATTKLTCLTSLWIDGSPELTFLRNNHKLQILLIRQCPKFQEFRPNKEGQFLSSSLQSLEIRDCPMLTSVPDVSGLTSLRGLLISDCKKLKILPKGVQCLTALESLIIGGFWKEMDSFPFLTGVKGTKIQPLVSLRRLEISGWSKLHSLPDKLQLLTTLQELTVRDFPNLMALPEWLKNLCSLQRLEICGCENLKHIPSKRGMRCLSALKKLEISKCPLLKIQCAMETGEEWHKIAHIPQIRMDYNLVQSLAKD